MKKYKEYKNIEHDLIMEHFNEKLFSKRKREKYLRKSISFKINSNYILNLETRSNQLLEFNI